MTTLVVDELLTSFEQPIRIKQKIMIASIKAHLYVHNMPSGNFVFSIEKEGNHYAAFNFTCADLRSSFGGSENFFHVFMPFTFAGGTVFDRGDYTFKITQTGYIYSASAFLGWCKDFGGYFGDISDPEAEFTEYPYSFRIIQRKPREF